MLVFNEGEKEHQHGPRLQQQSIQKKIHSQTLKTLMDKLVKPLSLDQQVTIIMKLK